uniref:Uncharacterized protein n=1 Tax=Cacopsylla melanoneura TaxID=428564 RepID=A0A8D8Z0A0_9HEMI
MRHTEFQFIFQVWAEHTTLFPSIDDQVNVEMEAFDLLCEGGHIREILMDRITRILKEDYERGRPEYNATHESNDTMYFNESHHPIYLKKDNSLPQRVLDGVFKEALFLGTNESKSEMKKHIKEELSNGTLTEVEVDNVLHMMVDKMREKTTDELKKYIDELVSGVINNKMAKGKQKQKKGKKGKQNNRKQPPSNKR